MFEVGVLERRFVAAVAGFEIFCAPDVFVGRGFGSGGFIDDILSDTVALKWAFVFLAFLAVAFLYVCSGFLCGFAQ